jgi:hypothetical protein
MYLYDESVDIDQVILEEIFQLYFNKNSPKEQTCYMLNANEL